MDDVRAIKQFGVSARRNGSFPEDDEISVNFGFSRRQAGEYQPLRLRSSDRVNVSLGDDFSDRARDVIKRRRRSGGKRKGRVLYLMHQQAPLAALAFHVPATGPLEIQALVASNTLPDAVTARFHGWLLACLQEASNRLGRPQNQLAWSTNNKPTANAARTVYDFQAASRPKACRMKYYLLRL
jgi:hypothetical protein